MAISSGDLGRVSGTTQSNRISENRSTWHTHCVKADEQLGKVGIPIEPDHANVSFTGTFNVIEAGT